MSLAKVTTACPRALAGPWHSPSASVFLLDGMPDTIVVVASLPRSACGSYGIVFGMTWNEIGLVVFLFVLITSWGVLPRVGDGLGALFGGNEPSRGS